MTHFRILALLLCAAWVGCATTPVPVDSGQLIFWEILNPALDAEAPPGEEDGVVHILGSVHFGRKALDFDRAIDHALDRADVLVFEIEPGELDPSLMLEAILEMGRLPEGETLQQQLPAETWEALVERLDEAGLEPSGFNLFEPWVVMIQIIGLDVAAAGLDSAQGVETQLLNREEDPRPMLGLETARFQLELFDQLPVETQIALLDDTLRGGSDGNADSFDLILDAWEAGDDLLLSELTNPEAQDEHSRLFLERVFTARNYNMADGVAALLQEPKRYFVTIGAGHTIGETGVPELLRQRGFQVRRIPRSRELMSGPGLRFDPGRHP